MKYKHLGHEIRTLDTLSFSSIKNTVSLKLMNHNGAKNKPFEIIDWDLHHFFLHCSFQFYFRPSVRFVNELAVKRLDTLTEFTYYFNLLF